MEVVLDLDLPPFRLKKVVQFLVEAGGGHGSVRTRVIGKVC